MNTQYETPSCNPTQNNKTQHSSAFELLAASFSAIHPPYIQEDAVAFTSVFRSVYSSLNREEKSYAEIMLDLLVEGLERRDLSSLIPDLVYPVDLAAA
jgi:hypothetical protein